MVSRAGTAVRVTGLVHVTVGYYTSKIIYFVGTINTLPKLISILDSEGFRSSTRSRVTKYLLGLGLTQRAHGRF